MKFPARKKGCDHVSIVYKYQSNTAFRSANIRVEVIWMLKQ